MEPSNVRRGLCCLATAFAVAVSGCGDDSPTTPVGGGGGGGGGGAVMTDKVNVDDNVFVPAGIQVSPGTDVTWTWVGSNPHNVTFSSSSIEDSGTQTSGDHSALMPATPGTYAYECTIHSGMSGFVIVQ